MKVKSRRASVEGLLLGVFIGLAQWASGESVADHAVLVSATVQASAAQVVLYWPADSQATSYAIYRKGRDDTSWGTEVASLPGKAEGFVDSDVTVGGRYEYRVSKSAASYSGVGYIFVGIQAPLVEFRGKVVLVVDETFSGSLSNELARLEQDLIGDGWTVLRHDVARMVVDPSSASSNLWGARSNEVANLKALVKADFEADVNATQALFLFGHVPIPYSGNTGPDAHSLHIGAWPADVYYGDLEDAWTDSSWNTVSASDTRNWNQRYDGKFDVSSLFEIEARTLLQVGRVDMANLSSFTKSETQLLRQYLEKNHRFRHKLFSVQSRGLIEDNFGVSGAGAPVAVNGWRNFAPFFGAANISTASNWFNTLADKGYLWGYGCGGGTYTSCSGVGSTADFVTKDPQVVFTMFFGSYFGDWDSPNNFLRAALGTANYTLTSAWVGRPNWQVHHMALGETIGFSTRLTQNNAFLYEPNSSYTGIHIALMGDPTLRMHVVGPPSSLTATANGSEGVGLSWGASTDVVLGYHVYRASTEAGPFTRLNSQLITATNYTDSVSSSCVYMVRAIKLEVSGSGTYYNASQGIFTSYSPDVVLPATTTGQVSSSVNPALPGETVAFTCVLSAVAPGAGAPTGVVQFKVDGVNIAAPLPLSGGVASFTNATLAHGSHTITAEYAGNDSFLGSTNSLAGRQVVNSPPVAGEVTVECDPAEGGKIPVTMLLGQVSDADGDGVSLVGVDGSSANGGTVANAGAWVFYSPPALFGASDTFGYSVSDGWVSATGVATVKGRTAVGPSASLVVTDLGDASRSIRGDGIPGREYQIEFAEKLEVAEWKLLAVVTADENGIFGVLDPSGATQRVYRAVSPQ